VLADGNSQPVAPAYVVSGVGFPHYILQHVDYSVTKLSVAAERAALQ
jgi:hypothetical protein